MSTADIAAEARDSAPDVRARKALAFTGVAPLAAFVVVHMIATTSALWGGARFEHVMGRTRTVAMTVFALVILPLAFHAAYGAYLMTSKKWRPAFGWVAPRLRNIAAWGTLLYLVWHLADLARIGWPLSIRAEGSYDAMVLRFSTTFHGVPLFALGTLVGITATALHLGFSLYTFVLEWAVVRTARSIRIAAWGFGALGALVFFLGLSTTLYLTTGTRLVFGPRDLVVQPDGPPRPDCPPIHAPAGKSGNDGK